MALKSLLVDKPSWRVLLRVILALDLRSRHHLGYQQLKLLPQCEPRRAKEPLCVHCWVDRVSWHKHLAPTYANCASAPNPVFWLVHPGKDLTRLNYAFALPTCVIALIIEHLIQPSLDIAMQTAKLFLTFGAALYTPAPICSHSAKPVLDVRVVSVLK